MARNSNSKRNKNMIQNVRVVDKDEGTDDIQCQRYLQAYTTSEGQIRVVMGFRTELSNYTANTVQNGTVGYSDAVGTDDFLSFAAQYQEFRIRAMRFEIYDLQPNNTSVVNFWSTYHTNGGSTPIDLESVVDRTDSRSVPPGDGKVSLAWVAHGIPEMGFQSTTAGSVGLGGLTYYTLSQAAITNTKYSVIAKFVVDFRGRK